MGDVVPDSVRSVGLFGHGGCGKTTLAEALLFVAGAGERPIYQAETIDAYAWAITAIPNTTLDSTGRRVLRRSGIQKLTPLGRA